MAKEKKVKEIDVESLDSELAAARTLEEGKGSPFVKAAAVVAFCMTLFHIATGFLGQLPYAQQRGFHLAFGITIVLLTIPLHDHFFDNGPMLFDGMEAKSLTLRSAVSGRFVELGIADFPNLCLWGAPTRMSLIAIEPWIGTSDRVDTDHIWENKPGIQVVQQGQVNIHTLTFRVG